MRRPAKTAVILTAMIGWAASGCSAVLSRPPAALPLQSMEDCSRSPAPAILDVVAAAASGGAAMLSLGIAAQERREAQDEVQPSWARHSRADAQAGEYLAVGIGAGVAAIALAVSARHGFDSVSRCRAARRELQMRLPPPGWSPPGSPQWSPRP